MSDHCMYYVYFLWSEKLQRVYIGYTSNLKTRFRNHNAGSQRYTKKGIPWKFVACVPFSIEAEARAEEKRLKRCKNRDYLRWYIQQNGKKLITIELI